RALWMSFSSSCGDLRSRLSFPTRRSSDLALSGSGPCRQADPRLRHARRGRRAQAGTAFDEARRDDRDRGRAETGIDGGVAEHARDRKSTRLNSSHVKISYAVFCLKKKTN